MVVGRSGCAWLARWVGCFGLVLGLLWVLPGSADAARPLYRQAKRHLCQEQATPRHVRVMVFPGYSNRIWGPIQLNRLCDERYVRLEQLYLPNPYGSRHDEVAIHLARALEEEPVLVVAYSLGADALMRVLVDANLRPDQVRNLAILLLAPATNLRRPWNGLLDKRRQRDIDEGLTLLESWSRQPEYRGLFQSRMAVLYGTRDMFVRTSGLDEHRVVTRKTLRRPPPPYQFGRLVALLEQWSHCDNARLNIENAGHLRWRNDPIVDHFAMELLEGFGVRSKPGARARRKGIEVPNRYRLSCPASDASRPAESGTEPKVTDRHRDQADREG